jgi:poly(3-hydroxybutyrate) depolymerase
MFFFISCIFRCSLWATVFASLFAIPIVNVSAQESRSIEVNPGNLAARIYVPPDLGAGRPLVVALHGCGQTAEDYDNETGWTALADEMKFVLLLPEQKITNNPASCFNWFAPSDSTRGHGEAESIKQMAEAAIQQ